MWSTDGMASPWATIGYLFKSWAIWIYPSIWIPLLSFRPPPDLGLIPNGSPVAPWARGGSSGSNGTNLTTQLKLKISFKVVLKFSKKPRIIYRSCTLKILRLYADSLLRINVSFFIKIQNAINNVVWLNFVWKHLANETCCQSLRSQIMTSHD